MGLGDSINSLSGGYALGKAQYAANEKTRQEKAEKAAKAAQDAAEFRLKLAQHSQTLTNSAEAEWNAIMGAVTGENWDPAYLPVLLPRAANFDKTYGNVWGGGSAVKNLQDALHLGADYAPMDSSKQGPQTEGQASGLFGFLSPEQKSAADEKALKSRSAEVARGFAVQAMEYVREKGGGLPSEAEFYKRVYDFQEMAQKSGDYDPKAIDDAMDIIRENAAGYYKGLSAEIERATGRQGLSDNIQARIDQVGKESSAWIKSLLLMDAQGNALTGDLFAERSPLQLEMERSAQAWAMQGMSTGQIKANLIFKHRDAMGGLNLDIKDTPYAGSLTLMDAPPEFKNVVNRFYDLNESPDEDMMVPMWDSSENKGWVMDMRNPNNSRVIYEPIPTPENPTVLRSQGTPYMKVPAGANATGTTANPSQPMPGKAVLPGQTGKIAERASRAEQSAKAAADYASTKEKVDASARAKRDEGAAKVAMRLGGREWAMSNISESMDPLQVESAIVKHIRDVLEQTGSQSLASGGFSQQAQRLYESVKDKVVPADTYQETAARVLEAALGKAKQ